MTVVYRVEKHTPHWGINEYLGPYRHYDTDFKLSSMIYRHSDANNHPTPSNEGWPRYEDCRFGFTSLEQLYQWFNKDECDVLTDNGFEIGIYDVPRVIRRGKKQCMFNYKKAKRRKETLEIKKEE